MTVNLTIKLVVNNSDVVKTKKRIISNKINKNLLQKKKILKKHL